MADQSQLERLARAKAQIPAIKKTRTAPSSDGTTYSYAPLDEMQAAVAPALASEGFMLTATTNETGLILRLLDVRAGGEPVLETRVPLVIPGLAGPHEAGAAITYARRYALSLLLDLVAEDDTDAAAPQGLVAKAKAAVAAAKAPAPAPAAAAEDDDEVPARRLCEVCGEPLKRRTGTNAEGRPWAGWFCPDRKHPVVWEK